MEEWEKKLKESGNLEKKALNRSHKKIAPEKLRTYVEEHPDAYQMGWADDFDYSVTAIQKALKSIGITRKKKIHYMEQNPQKSKTLSRENQRDSRGK